MLEVKGNGGQKQYIFNIKRKLTPTQLSSKLLKKTKKKSLFSRIKREDFGGRAARVTLGDIIQL